MHLTPKGLLVKLRKKDRLFFDAAHLVYLFSTCVNNFTSTEDEIEPHYRKTSKNHLKRICNLRITCEFKEILLFNDDVSGTIRNKKLYLDIVGAHAFIIGSTLYVLKGKYFLLKYESS